MALEKLVEKDGLWTGEVNITADGKKDEQISTGGKYVDKNIKITINTPDAEFERKNISGGNGVLTATAAVTDASLTYVSDSETDFPITVTAKADVESVTVGTKTAGFTAATDTITIDGGTTNNSKTVYIKKGSLEGSGTASAEGGNGVDLTSVGTTPPDSGFYVKASAAGSVSVKAAGWLATGTTADASGADQYYTLPTVNLANTATEGKTYDEVLTPVLTEGGYLFINEGYTEGKKISLATLVPDSSNLPTVVEEGADGLTSDLMYNTVTAYNKDGKLVAGTMGNATIGNITANDAAATVDSVSIAANDNNTAFKVTGTKAISGNTSVEIVSRGLAKVGDSKTGSISGTATVDATIGKVGLGTTIDDDTITVTPVISTSDASTASIAAITTTAPKDGYYVAVNTAKIDASTTVSPKVTTAGYGTTTVFDASSATVTAGAAASGLYYVPINPGSHSVSELTPTVSAPVTTVTTSVSNGDITPVIVAEADKNSAKQYIKIDASSTTADGSVQMAGTCTITEGYIAASIKNFSKTETVSVAGASATAKYIEVFDGSWDKN